jgi:hypothetical protein
MEYSEKGQSKQIKSTAAQAGPRPGSPPARDERDFMLPLWRAAELNGINRNDCLKGTGPLNGRQVTQVGRLVHDLEVEGFIFKHERRDDSQFVYYVLVAEPNEPKKPMKPSSWRSQGFGFGNPAKYNGNQRTPNSQPNLFRTLADVRSFVAAETGASK